MYHWCLSFLLHFSASVQNLGQSHQKDLPIVLSQLQAASIWQPHPTINKTHLSQCSISCKI
uniref:CSON011004 protein n=1 Tax=Culicoides sonorensis TaxID=179676 RepID=A0A336KTE1_CULSO